VTRETGPKPRFPFLDRLAGPGGLGWLRYHLGLRLRGIDVGPSHPAEPGLGPERANPHGNSGGPSLARLLRILAIPPGSRVVDLGSGKGGAILTLARFGFEEIVGVEISAELIRISEANFRRAGLRGVTLVHGDAAEFVDLDRFSHVYMYHPFPCPVVERVVANLSASLARRDRRLMLVYANPVCERQVAACGRFRTLLEAVRFHPRAPARHTYSVFVHE
jgi:SAM-dependent methyltransferase